jgi:glycosyltransferase involved in cell wall biosynthesis
MKICLLEAFFTGSHKSWAEAYRHFSQHEVDILSLPGRHWKWRMHGAAITLAQQYLSSSKQADLLLATDLLDLNIFLSLTRSQTNGIPTALYFHENQLTYPWSPTDPDVALKRDNHYAFIQYASALAADQLFFNSAYHQHSFLSHLPDFLKQFPDFKTLDQLPALEAKAQVLPLGLDLSYLDGFKTDRLEGPPVLLWNHRWEYDKNPEAFYEALIKLVADHIDFRLIVLGESFPKSPSVFKKIQHTFYKQLLHFGYAADKADYAKFLWQADIIPVTSNQDFFGGSVVEAIYADCIPLLPNRLAYAEHIPEALHATYMYQSEEDFYPRLKSLILNFKTHKPDAALKQLVKRYNWRNLAPRYDAVFAAMAK